MQVKTIVNDVAREVGDIALATWTRSTLISLLNQAVRQVVLVRPDANEVTESYALSAGTKQVIPVDSQRLLKVVRNMGADGATPGHTIKIADAELLDIFDPNWHSSTAKNVVESYVYDESAPDVFYVYPPSDASTQVEISVSKIPAELDAAMDDATFDDAATVVGLRDIYMGPIIEWMLYKTFSHENASSSSLSLAADHRSEFYRSLGVKTQADVSHSPKSEKPHGTA